MMQRYPIDYISVPRLDYPIDEGIQNPGYTYSPFLHSQHPHT